MLSQTLSAPNPWRALFWKDMRQVQSVVAVLVASTVFIQVLLWFVALLSGNLNLVNQIGISIACSCVAIVLVMIASAGALVGHERQTGSWVWNSTLPIAWTTALTSHLVATFLSIFLAGCLTIAFPAFLCWNQAPEMMTVTWVSVISTTLGSMLAACIFFWCVLFFDDALLALVVGVFLSPVVLWLMLALVTYLGLEFRMQSEIALVFVGSAFFVAELGILMALYRWRWTTAPSVNGSWLSRPRSMDQTELTYTIRTTGLVGEFSSLWKLGLNQSYLCNIVVTALTIGFLGYYAIVHAHSRIHMIGVGWVTLQLSALGFGLGCFLGEQKPQRFAFLADRGTFPGPLLASRILLPAVIWVCLAAIFSLAVGIDEYLPTTIAVAGAMLCIGCICSITSQRTVVSIPLGLSLGGIYLTLTSFPLLSSNGGDFWFVNSMRLYVAAISLPILAVSVYFLLRFRLRMAPKSPTVGAVGVLSAGFLLPPLLALSLGFLVVPHTSWQGERPTQSAVELPELLSLAPEASIQDQAWTDAFAQSIVGSTRSNDGATSQASVQSERMVSVSKAAAAENLNRLIRLASAPIGAALEADNLEKAREASEVYLALTEMAEQLAPVETLQARATSLSSIHQLLIMYDPSSLGTVAELTHWFLPPQEHTKEELARWYREQAFHMREFLRSNTSHNQAVANPEALPLMPRWLPPLRWREERILALELSLHLDALSDTDMETILGSLVSSRLYGFSPGRVPWTSNSATTHGEFRYLGVQQHLDDLARARASIQSRLQSLSPAATAEEGGNSL